MMANVKLKEHRATGPLLLRRGGESYALTAQEETHVPLRIAAGMLGDEGLLVEFNAGDEKDILSASDRTLELLKQEFGLEGDAKAVHAAMFPKKESLAAKAVKAVTPAPKEEVKVEEPVEEEPVEEAQDYSLLTVKKLKAILEEKGLSTDGKKADLIERLSAGDE